MTAGNTARPKLRILIVDDIEDAGVTLQLLLEGLGHEARYVRDGEAAVRQVLEFKPALVFLDLGMPGMSGHEVAQQIRSQNGQRPLYIVALSGWSRQEDRERSREVGIDIHLIKPLELGLLQSILQSVQDAA